MKHDSNLYEVNKEARLAGIKLPVYIDGSLIKILTPTPYLESLGITKEQRIKNLLSLVHATLTPQDESLSAGDDSIPVPFMVLKGPLVREDCFTVTININTNDEGKKAITISCITDSQMEEDV